MLFPLESRRLGARFLFVSHSGGIHNGFQMEHTMDFTTTLSLYTQMKLSSLDKAGNTYNGMALAMVHSDSIHTQTSIDAVCTGE